MNSRKFIPVLIISLLSLPILSSAANSEDAQFTIGINAILFACSLLLLFVIIALGNTLYRTIQYYHAKKLSKLKDSSKKILSVILLLGVMPAAARAQDAAVDVSPLTDDDVVRWLLGGIIIIEITIIFLFAYLISVFSGARAYYNANRKVRKPRFILSKWWYSINKFQPLEEEASIDTGHSYDGIRELNNITPPWFVAGFILSIVFGIVYMWRYHVAESAPLQVQELAIENRIAEEKIAEYMRTQTDNVDEFTVKLMDETAIAAGKNLFATNCAVCHGSEGQGAAIGPNLIDNYWLHGGGIQNVFKSIKYGWQDKGMKSWQDDFSAKQIAQISSYIISMAGKSFPDAKEPQGTVYKPEGGTEEKDATANN